MSHVYYVESVRYSIRREHVQSDEGPDARIITMLIFFMFMGGKRVSKKRGFFVAVNSRIWEDMNVFLGGGRVFCACLLVRNERENDNFRRIACH